MTGANAEQIMEKARKFHCVKGLYWKDFIRVFKTWPILLVITVSVCVGLWMTDSLVGLICFFCIMLMMQGPSSILADRTCGWFDFEPSLPISRKHLVTQKYMLSMMLMGLGLVIGLLMSWCMTWLKTGTLELTSEAQNINLLICAVIGFSSCAIILPLSFVSDKDKFFLSIVLSFLPAALMIYLWTQGITTSDPIPAAGTAGGFYVDVDMNLGMLKSFAALSAALLVLSWAAVPGFLAKRDRL